jgi:Spy/CpxP family protein refolding chaperone
VNSWRIILATMVIFGTGVLTGGLLVGHYRPEHIAARPANPGGPGKTAPAQPTTAGGMRVEFLRRMSRDLDLSPDQHAQVDKILRDSQERTKKIMSPYLREETDRTSKEFRDVLTAEQRTRFDDLLKQKRVRDPRRPAATPASERPDGARQALPAVVTNN